MSAGDQHLTTDDRLQELIVSAQVRKSDQRREYVLGHLFLLNVVVAAAITGPLMLLFPTALEASALGQSLPYGLERVWAVVYSIAGLLVLIGLFELDARYEVGGLTVLAGCFAAYGYAIFDATGWAPGAVIAILLFTLAAGCASRAFVLRFEPNSGRPWQRRASS